MGKKITLQSKDLIKEPLIYSQILPTPVRGTQVGRGGRCGPLASPVSAAGCSVLHTRRRGREDLAKCAHIALSKTPHAELIPGLPIGLGLGTPSLPRPGTEPDAGQQWVPALRNNSLLCPSRIWTDGAPDMYSHLVFCCHFKMAQTISNTQWSRGDSRRVKSAAQAGDTSSRREPSSPL